MKTILLCLILGTFYTQFNLYSQAPEKIVSNVDKFGATSGTLIQKSFKLVGYVKGVEMKVMTLKDLNTESTVSALRFSLDTKTGYSKSTKIASIDADEIDGLLKSIKKLEEQILNTTPEVYTEVTFKSRSGFEAGAFYGESDKKWSAYMKLEKFDSDSFVFMSTEDLKTLQMFIEAAIECMSSVALHILSTYI